MMYNGIWKKLHGSICSINFFSDNGIKLSSLTGFRIANSIITDEYVYKIPKCEEVVFQFVKDDGYSVNKAIKMAYADFSERINRLAEFENEGFALIDMEEAELEGVPLLEIEFGRNYTIGQQIAVIGYHIDQDNLSIKNGIISSFFKAHNRRYIQFDAAIKQGNSGSPLIDLATGKVIGVVGYRLSAISKSYDAFKKIIEDNLKMLKKSEGKMNIMDVDPIQVLMANQHQLKQISKEFYRSATMSFGYAHEIHTLESYISQPAVSQEESQPAV